MDSSEVKRVAAAMDAADIRDCNTCRHHKQAEKPQELSGFMAGFRGMEAGHAHYLLAIRYAVDCRRCLDDDNLPEWQPFPGESKG